MLKELEFMMNDDESTNLSLALFIYILFSFWQKAGVYDERQGVCDDFFFGQGGGVQDERAGVYDDEDRQFMRKSGHLCTKAVCRVRFPD